MRSEAQLWHAMYFDYSTRWLTINMSDKVGVCRSLIDSSAVTCSSELFFNTLRPRQHGRHFADDTFKCIFLNENVWIPVKFSLKYVPKGPINNIPPLVQIMAWRRSGDKPLSEPMMVDLPTYICVTRPQWVKIIDLCIPWSYTTFQASVGLAFRRGLAEVIYPYPPALLHGVNWKWVNRSNESRVTLMI